MIDSDKFTNDIMQKMCHDMLTVSQASKIIGISPRVLQRLEEGGKPMSIPVLEKVLTWLGNPLSEYVTNA